MTLSRRNATSLLRCVAAALVVITMASTAAAAPARAQRSHDAHDAQLARDAQAARNARNTPNTTTASPLSVHPAANSVDTMNCTSPTQGTHCIRFRCAGNCLRTIADEQTTTVTFGVTAESLADLGAQDCVIRDLNFALDFEHGDVGDLMVSLAKGAAAPRSLYSPGTGCNATAFDGVFDDESAVAANTCPFGGSTLQSDETLSPFDGLDPVGDWTLTIEDLVSQDSGILQDYGLALDLTCSTTPGGGCVETPTTLCLNANRFRVQAQFQVPGGALVSAQAVELTTDTGYIYYFNSANVEAVIKVLNGCGVNNRFWVFAGGLTNVRVVFTVTDTQTGVSRTYTNPQSTPFQPIQDTGAFATCP